MLPDSIVISFFSVSANLIFFIIAVILAMFLFWRAGRYELISSEILFDVIGVSIAGSLLFGRIFDFLLRPEFYYWSIKKLVFFNIYSGFNFWGALIGAGIAVTFLLKIKKTSIWYVFDYAAAPLALSLAIVSLGKTLTGDIFFYTLNLFFNIKIGFLKISNTQSLYYFGSYFILFWLLKRLETQKKHIGFFSNLFLCSIMIINLIPNLNIMYRIGINHVLINQILIFLIILAFVLANWYFLAKRNIINDSKNIFAYILLVMFKMKRMIFSIEETSTTAKSAIFFPAYLVKSFYCILRFVVHELYLGICGFLKVFRGTK